MRYMYGRCISAKNKLKSRSSNNRLQISLFTYKMKGHLGVFSNGVNTIGLSKRFSGLYNLHTIWCPLSLNPTIWMKKKENSQTYLKKINKNQTNESCCSDWQPY